jgi:DNA-binding NtrC family response regulator
MKPRVLVADDEAGILLTLRAILERNGFQVETAASALQATEKLTVTVFDLVITDMRMEHPHAGYDVIAAAQQLSYQPPTVLLTAYPPVENEWKAHGASALFEKPVNVPALVAELHALVKRRRRATA